MTTFGKKMQSILEAILKFLKKTTPMMASMSKAALGEISLTVTLIKLILTPVKGVEKKALDSQKEKEGKNRPINKQNKNHKRNLTK